MTQPVPAAQPDPVPEPGPALNGTVHLHVAAEVVKGPRPAPPPPADDDAGSES